MKYPIGIQDFESLRKDNYIYVDKTALVYKLADEGKYYFLSRPRRFGKSLLLSTLEAYFLGKRELFQGLALEGLEAEWAEHPVLHLDLNTDNYNAPDTLRQRLNLFLSDAEARYGHNDNEVTLPQRFEGVIKRAATKAGRRVVILVDEYDKPMLQAIGDEGLQAEFRSTLKAFYGALKSQDRHIRFAFLTGVTKYWKLQMAEAVNNLYDISMANVYQTLCGFTEEEVNTHLREDIARAAEKLGQTHGTFLGRLWSACGGYRFHEKGYTLCNPWGANGSHADRKAKWQLPARRNAGGVAPT